MVEFKILVVDDSSVNRVFLCKILEQAGFIPKAVSSGEEALDAVKKDNFYCILLDILMPGLNGYEVIGKLKSTPIIKDIPVIFITGQDSEESTIKGFELGAVDYITKPFSFAEVKARVRSQVKLFSTIKSLETAQSDMIREISNAQNSLLKKPEDIPEANFSVYYKSLHAAGGDIYDIINVSPTKIGYFVGDFAGHSISTSFLTSSIKALLQQNCNDINTPIQSMDIINRVLVNIVKEGQYLTACYAELNLTSNEMTVVNMGHPPLIVLRSDHKSMAIGKNGDVLGAFPEAFFVEDHVTLIPSDRFIIYTDGLIEGEKVWSSSTSFLRKKALSHFNKSREELLENLITDTEPLRIGSDDDIMVLVSDIKGDSPKVNILEDGNSIKVEYGATNRLTSSAVNAIFTWIKPRLPSEDYYGVKISLYEACSNAVIHGNRSNYRKKVTIICSIENSLLSIAISDEGGGFDWQSKLNRELIENLEENGRGLKIFAAYGFTVNYNSRGNQLVLKKTLSQ